MREKRGIKGDLEFGAEKLEWWSCHQERKGRLQVSSCGSFNLDMLTFRLDMKIGSWVFKYDAQKEGLG